MPASHVRYGYFRLTDGAGESFLMTVGISDSGLVSLPVAGAGEAPLPGNMARHSATEAGRSAGVKPSAASIAPRNASEYLPAPICVAGSSGSGLPSIRAWPRTIASSGPRPLLMPA